MKGLNGEGTFVKLMREAVENVQHYTQSNQNPLEVGTKHVEDNNDMWILTLSKWMGKKQNYLKNVHQKYSK